MKLNILGTQYTVIQDAKENDYPQLLECGGFCDTSVKRIVIAKLKKTPNSIADLDAYKQKVLRHEAVHALLYESGLSVNCEWATDETLVDWIAIQFPKMLEIFEKAGAL